MDESGESMADFERMYSENCDFILRYLTKLCRDPSLAEELTQETFFRAYMNLGRLREEARAPVWLCQIAKNAYYARYNEAKGTAPLEEDAVSGAAGPEDAFVQKELSREAFSRLHALPEPYREVFLLHVFANLSLTDISALFGKSESWARVTLCRAKKQLREGMRKHDQL